MSEAERSPPAAPPLSASTAPLGRYPTLVQHLPRLSRPAHDLWVKRDDLTGELYGGNKVRKLEGILREAARRGASRLVTFGAAGSHHVLASAIYGRRAGLRVAALLTPQPATLHAEEDLRAAVGLGLEAHPVRHPAALPFALARVLSRGDYVVPPGGSNVAGSLGYFHAGAELMAQVAEGALPLPGVVVVPLGSGGTAAGLVAGLWASGFRGKVVAVRVVSPWLAGAWATLALACAVARAAGVRATIDDLRPHLEVEGRYLGRGYGFPTTAGERATHLVGDEGVRLEPTYTAKTFAVALERVAHGPEGTILYWHTFSSAPLGPFLATAPPLSDLPAALRALLTDGASPA